MPYLRLRQVRTVQETLATLLEEPHAPNHALGAAILAPSGWGKTSLVKDFLESEHAKRVDGLRYAFVALPSNATPKNLASRTLEVLGDPAPSHGNAAEMTNRIAHLLREGRYDLLVFDDVNNISDGDSFNKRRLGARWIEELLNTGGTPIIMTARLEFLTVLQENPFLQRRLKAIPPLTGLRWNDRDDLRDFRGVLGEMEIKFGMAARVACLDRDLSTRLCIATDGLLGYLERIVEEAAAMARRKGLGSLTTEMLKEVTRNRQAMSLSPARDPFEVKTEDLHQYFGTATTGGRKAH